MKELSIEIDNLIKERHKITFRDFMQIALYHPKYGYYSRHVFPFGGRGDFVTSPHTHALFGALLARQIMQMWEIAGRADFKLVEMGAGSGFLARDILTYLSDKEIFDYITYVIIEPLENLKNFQRKCLNNFRDKVVFIPDIAELPPFSGCFLSNELLDAFPVHLMEYQNNRFLEVYVCGNHLEGFRYCLDGPSSSELTEYFADIRLDFEDGYRTEVNLEIRKWIDKLSSVMNKGFILTIDYGHTAREYFHPARNRGTLLAYRGQTVNENVMCCPGDQDITAHVNFTDLHKWGQQVGFCTLGYTSQWAFLAGLDVESTLKELGDDLEPFSEKRAALKMLFLPQGMGESHKVLIQSKNIPAGVTLKGLSMRNIVKRLDQ